MTGQDLGSVELGGTLTAALAIGDGTSPIDPAVAPGFRIYGSGSSAMPAGTGSLTKLDTGTITGATNASPIVVTSAGHNLTTGTRVTISGVVGNTAANGDFTITVINSSTFSLNGSTGNAGYTSGGTWHVTGLYALQLSVASGNGYLAGSTYFAFVSWTSGVTAYAMSCPFTVI